MFVDSAAAPQNRVEFQARLDIVMSLLAARDATLESLRQERDALKAERDTAHAEVEKLQLIIKQLQRSQYGPRAEQIDPDQLQLGLEEVEQSLGAAQAGVAREPATDQTASGERKPAQRNRGALPPHLPRVEIVVDVEDKRCPCCGGAMHVIGEDRSERLDVIPAWSPSTATICLVAEITRKRQQLHPLISPVQLFNEVKCLVVRTIVGENQFKP